LVLGENDQETLFGFDFVLGPNATGAEFHLLGFSIHHHGSCMYIGIKTPIGMLFGMADILSKHGGFTANLALQDMNSLRKFS
jgi:hypothetical protein